MKHWCGVGICKLYQLANGRTIEEALFCFEKAKEIDNKLKDDIDCQFIMHSSNVIITFTEYLINAIIEAKAQKAKATLGAIMTGISIVAGSSSNANMFTQIGSLVAGGAGVGIAKDGFSKATSLEDLASQIANLIDSIVECVVSNTNSNLVEHELFIGLADELVIKIEEKRGLINSGNKPSGLIKFLIFFPHTGIFGVHKMGGRKLEDGIIIHFYYWWIVFFMV